MHVGRPRIQNRRRGGQPVRQRCSAFSLTELLVASAIGLLVMASVATLFSVFSRALSEGQSTIEMASKMRTAGWRLRRDLAGITVRIRPPARPEANAGYFELIEGPLSDNSASPNSPNLSADTDDTLFFTTTSAGGLFSGRYGSNDTAESGTAEVAWFCRLANPDATSVPLPAGMQVFNLYRRQLLVLGYAGKDPFFSKGNRAEVTTDVKPGEYDISLRQEVISDPVTLVSKAMLVPNSLADLADRRNRFGHNPAAFPFPLTLASDGRAPMNLTFDETARAWEDVVLTNVIAFDVRVFDPPSTAQPTAGTSFFPGDPGYVTGNGAYGAYIDLGSGQGTGLLSGPMAQKSRMSGPPTYCTWSTAYELNGRDEDGDGKVDPGANGTDDNGNGLFDEATEAETLPPYPVSLRGIEVRIRCYEPVSKQVRQITIRQAFN